MLACSDGHVVFYTCICSIGPEIHMLFLFSQSLNQDMNTKFKGDDYFNFSTAHRYKNILKTTELAVILQAMKEVSPSRGGFCCLK